MKDPVDPEINKSRQTKLLGALHLKMGDDGAERHWERIRGSISDYRVRIATYSKEEKKRSSILQVDNVRKKAGELVLAFEKLSGRAEKWMRIELGGDSDTGLERALRGREEIRRVISLVDNIERRAAAAKFMVGRTRTTIERRALRFLLLDLNGLWIDLHGHSGLDASGSKRACFGKFGYIVANIANKKVITKSVFDCAFCEARKPDKASDMSGSGSGAN
jgi:hypothetical protein